MGLYTKVILTEKRVQGHRDGGTAEDEGKGCVCVYVRGFGEQIEQRDPRSGLLRAEEGREHEGHRPKATGICDGPILGFNHRCGT